MESIKNQDKFFKKYKSKLEIDHQFYKQAKKQTRRLITSKKIAFYDKTIQQNIGNSNKIWATLKSLGLPKNKVNDPNICLKKDGKTTIDRKMLIYLRIF